MTRYVTPAAVVTALAAPAMKNITTFAAFALIGLAVPATANPTLRQEIMRDVIHPCLAKSARRNLTGSASVFIEGKSDREIYDLYVLMNAEIPRNAESIIAIVLPAVSGQSVATRRTLYVEFRRLCEAIVQ